MNYVKQHNTYDRVLELINLNASMYCTIE